MTKSEPEPQNRLDQYIQDQPHLIIYGEPSSGKHSIVRTFLQKKYSPFSHYQHAVKWIQCIDPDNQQDLSGKVKQIGTSVYRPWTKNAIPYRVIVLDGIEYIPYTVQASLRRCIEVFSSHTRFILIGRHYQTLMKPIQSRFVIVQLQRPSPNLNYPTRVLRGINKYTARIKQEKHWLTSSTNKQTKSFDVEQPYLGLTHEYSTLFREGHTLIEQIEWLQEFQSACKTYTSFQCKEQSLEWLKRGWSSIDILNLLVYETKILMIQCDTTMDLKEKLDDLWHSFPPKTRYKLWADSRQMMKGQKYELFLINYLLTEIILVIQDDGLIRTSLDEH